MTGLEGKSAIITGARRGIGRACVELFAEQGANIWACARAQDDKFDAEMAELSSRHDVWIEPLYFDLADREAMRGAVKRIRDRRTDVDALVCCAGAIPQSTSFQMMSEASLRSTFEINFFAQVTLAQYIVRLMARQGSGAVVWVSSVAAIDGEPGQFEYVTSKAAVIGAARRMSAELGGAGIRVNAVAPGMIDTDMNAAIAPELAARTLARVPLGRRASPRECAAAIAFLASDAASYITGQTLRVDGGMI